MEKKRSPADFIRAVSFFSKKGKDHDKTQVNEDEEEKKPLRVTTSGEDTVKPEDKVEKEKPAKTAAELEREEMLREKFKKRFLKK